MTPLNFHYIWHGNKPVPEFFFRSVLPSWLKQFPADKWTWRQWTNTYVPDSSLLKELIAAENFGASSDLMRWWALYYHGGVYMDVDAIAYSNFSQYFDLADMTIGWEHPEGKPEEGYPAMGVVVGRKEAEVFKLLIDACRVWHKGIRKDSYVAGPGSLLEFFRTFGLKDADRGRRLELDVEGSKVLILPKEVFYPCNWNEIWSKDKIKRNTESIHIYTSTWKGDKQDVDAKAKAMEYGGFLKLELSEMGTQSVNQVGLDAAYLVNLDRRPDRAAEAQKELVRGGIGDVTRVSAFDGKVIGTSTTSMTAAHTACGLSHMKIWEAAALAGKRTFLVFEDDVVLEENFGKLFPWWMQTHCPEDWDVVLLGYYKDGANPQEAYARVLYPNRYPIAVPARNAILGSHAYLVKGTAAERMLAYANKAEHFIYVDKMLANMAHDIGLNVYMPVPQMAFQKGADTDIGNTLYNPNSLDGLEFLDTPTLTARSADSPQKKGVRGRPRNTGAKIKAGARHVRLRVR